jgi:rhodanese-related sulfurtransferase
MDMKWSKKSTVLMYQRLLILLVILCSFALKSQDLVKSTAYSIVLKGLLNKKVPHLGVADVEQISKTDIVFLDARERKEYDVSHIENALHVGYDSLDFRATDSLAKSTPIIVYCSVGYRSEKVTEKLIAKGFTNVKNLYGGLFEWVNQDGVIVNSQQEKTDSIHAFSSAWGIWLKKGSKTY